MTVKCSRCGEKMENRDFDVHVCKNMRNLMDMPHDLLDRVLKKEITESEAWKIVSKDVIT